MITHVEYRNAWIDTYWQVRDCGLSRQEAREAADEMTDYLLDDLEEG